MAKKFTTEKETRVETVWQIEINKNLKQEKVEIRNGSKKTQQRNKEYQILSIA